MFKLEQKGELKEITYSMRAEIIVFLQFLQRPRIRGLCILGIQQLYDTYK